MLAIVPATLTDDPIPECYYSLISSQSVLEQNLFIVPLLKIFSKKLPMHPLCTVINPSPYDVILPNNWHIGEMMLLSHTNSSVQHIKGVVHDISPNTVSANWTQQNIDPLLCMAVLCVIKS